MLIDQIQANFTKAIFNANVTTFKPFQIPHTKAKFFDSMLRLGVLLTKAKEYRDQTSLFRGSCRYGDRTKTYRATKDCKEFPPSDDDRHPVPPISELHRRLPLSDASHVRGQSRPLGAIELTTRIPDNLAYGSLGILRRPA